MIGIGDLPELNAGLNATAALLLSGGYAAVRRGRIALHKGCMIAAFACSTLFLASYLTHKYHEGHAAFPGEGVLLRGTYLAILLSHTILAAAVVPLAVITLVLGLRGRIQRHRRIARWTWPVWLYVSVTGVVLWIMVWSGAFGPRPGTT
jgi:uncharacterized membrane protein YozB (DUF420 family)